MTRKKQIVVIHGGEAHSTYDDYVASLRSRTITRERFDAMLDNHHGWKKSLQKALGGGCEVIAPQMPCGWNAKYSEWKIWFSKHMPFLQDDVILIGHSLGGVFLAKYLIENDLPVCVGQLHLVAAPIEDTPEESLCDFNFDDVEKLKTLEQKVPEIIIYHSEDDPVVPFKDGVAYAHYLENAEFVRFIDRGHFLQEEFPELVERI